MSDEAVRKEFEKWGKTFLEKIATHTPGEMSRKQVAWEAWQASRSAAIQECAEYIRE